MSAELSSPDDLVRPPPAGEGASVRQRAAMTSWVLLLVYGLMLAVVSLFWLVRGRLFDRELYETIGGVSWTLVAALEADVVKLLAALVRLGGALGLVAAVFVIAVSMTAYRRAERWAWYAMWSLPLLSTLDIAVLAGYRALSPTTVLWDLYMLCLALLGLMLPYPSFFRSPAEDRPRTSIDEALR